MTSRERSDSVRWPPSLSTCLPTSRNEITTNQLARKAHNFSREANPFAYSIVCMSTHPTLFSPPPPRYPLLSTSPPLSSILYSYQVTYGIFYFSVLLSFVVFLVVFQVSSSACLHVSLVLCTSPIWTRHCTTRVLYKKEEGGSSRKKRIMWYRLMLWAQHSDERAPPRVQQQYL